MPSYDTNGHPESAVKNACYLNNDPWCGCMVFQSQSLNMAAPFAVNHGTFNQYLAPNHTLPKYQPPSKTNTKYFVGITAKCNVEGRSSLKIKDERVRKDGLQP
ncbi:hypothetical protein TNCV_4917861 [Trichonephila clavipes]|nr:hypothetical protein TNCV_4917861 [Trichonephila clavipes]